MTPFQLERMFTYYILVNNLVSCQFVMFRLSYPHFVRENFVPAETYLSVHGDFAVKKHMRGAYHLKENFGNPCWKVNGKLSFRKFQPKIKE